MRAGNKRKIVVAGLALLLTLAAGCATGIEEETLPEGNGNFTMGSMMVGDVDEQLVLREQMEALAADGMYYAMWSAGDAVPYVNEEEETVDLYDAQLYLLLKESPNRELATEDMESWMTAGEERYQITDQAEYVCGEWTYTVMCYNCKSDANPYERGVSAFGCFGRSAVCVELTGREMFDGDLREMLEKFLESCSYRTD